MNCVKCSEPISNADAKLFEGMHWRCFHFTFEHNAAPEMPCDDPSCPLAEDGIIFFINSDLIEWTPQKEITIANAAEMRLGHLTDI